MPREILPSFGDLVAYATRTGDVPQRFYVSPELERSADWRLVLDDATALPVHSPMLAFSTDLFHGMLAEGLVPKDNTIALDDAHLADVLAIMRFTYDPESLTHDHVKRLAARGHAASVIRLAHKLGSRFVPKLVALSTDLTDIGHMPTLAEVALELGNDAMLHQCFTMMMAAARRVPPSLGAAVHFIKSLTIHDNPMAEAALLSLLAKNADGMTGAVCATLLDPHFPRDGITLVVEWNGQRVCSSWARGDGIDYQIIVNKVNKDAKEDEDCVNIVIKATPDALAERDGYVATIRLIDPHNVANSPTKRVPCDFSDTDRVSAWVATSRDLERCIDDAVTSIFTCTVHRAM